MNRKNFLTSILALPLAAFAAKKTEAKPEVVPPPVEPEKPVSMMGFQTPLVSARPFLLTSGNFYPSHPDVTPLLETYAICGESRPGCQCSVCRNRRETNRRTRSHRLVRTERGYRWENDIRPMGISGSCCVCCATHYEIEFDGFKYCADCWRKRSFRV